MTCFLGTRKRAELVAVKLGTTGDPKSSREHGNIHRKDHVMPTT